MLEKEELPFTDLSGRKVNYAISQKYYEGFDLFLGHNDSLKFLKTVPDKSVKLIITSPPYNIGKVYEERVKLDEYLDYQSQVAKECVRILRDDGSIAWEVGNYVYNKEIGLNANFEKLLLRLMWIPYQITVKFSLTPLMLYLTNSINGHILKESIQSFLQSISR